MSHADERVGWGESVRELRLGIFLELEHYRLPEMRIPLEILLASVRHERIKIVESSLLGDYELELFGEDGRLVPMKPEADAALRAAMTGEIRRRIVLEIEPNATHR